MAMAAAAALFSPRVRGLLQRGAISGLATMLSLGGRLSAGLAEVVQAVRPAANEGLEDITARR